MRKIKIHSAAIIAAIAISSITTSCDGLFRDAPIDKLSEKSIPKSELLLDEYTLSWYHNMNNGFDTFMSTGWLLRNMSKPFPAWYGDQLTYSLSTWARTGFADEQAAKETAINRVGKNEWGKYYEMIQHINRLLSNAGDIPSGPHKDRVLGEAHFFRGYYYYMLLRKFGAPLLINDLYDPLNQNKKFPRSNYTQMVEYIVREADEALSLLPAEQETQNRGRITRGAAMMLKAKTYFWAASPAFQNKEKDFYGFTDDQSQPMLQKAAEAYQAIIDANLYSLLPVEGTTQEEIAENYSKIFLTKNSKESILEVQHSNDAIVEEFGHRLDEDAISPFFGGTKCAYVPTQNHVDEYGMRDGQTYDPQNPYANRDYRFYANIIYDGAEFRKHVFEIHYTMQGTKQRPGADLTPHGTSRNAAVTRTGYYMRKFLDPTTDLFQDSKYGSKQNYIIWRYAELLLDYAEVQFRLGNQAKALQALNQVRQRAHMPALTTLTFEQILNERRVELAFEETTYWDFFRLGTAFDRLNGSTNPLRMIEIVHQTGGTVTYTITPLKQQDRERVFRPNQYYYPIPWAEIRYHGIEQNEGWHENE